MSDNKWALRERFDSECAKASDGMREACEEIADIVSRAVADRPEICERILNGKVKLTDAYEKMRKVAESKVDRRAGGITCYCLAGQEAERIIFDAFGITDALNSVDKPASSNVTESLNLLDLLG